MTASEADRVTELFALAFYEDPTWGWAFPDPDRRLEHQRRWWGMFVRGALPYEWTWTTATAAPSRCGSRPDGPS